MLRVLFLLFLASTAMADPPKYVVIRADDKGNVVESVGADEAATSAVSSPRTTKETVAVVEWTKDMVAPAEWKKYRSLPLRTFKEGVLALRPETELASDLKKNEVDALRLAIADVKRKMSILAAKRLDFPDDPEMISQEGFLVKELDQYVKELDEKSK